VGRSSPFRTIGSSNLAFGAVMVSALLSPLWPTPAREVPALAVRAPSAPVFSPLLPGDFSGTLTVPSSDPVRSTILVPLAGMKAGVEPLFSGGTCFRTACSIKSRPFFNGRQTPLSGYRSSSHPIRLWIVPFEVRTSKTVHIITSTSGRRFVDPGAKRWNSLLEGCWNRIRRPCDRERQSVDPDCPAQSAGFLRLSGKQRISPS